MYISFSLLFQFPTFQLLPVLNRNIHQSRSNLTTLRSSLSPLLFTFILPGARSPGEPGQTYLSICFSVLVLTDSFLQQHLFIHTWNSKLLLLLSFPPPPRVVSSLQQGLQVRQKRIPGEIQQYLFHYFVIFGWVFFFCPFLSVRLFSWENCCTQMIQNNSRKTSAVRSLYKECPTYSNNEKLTSGQAFAVSALFSCQSSDPSYPPVSLSVCLSANPWFNFLFCSLTFSLLRLLYVPINSSFIHLENAVKHKRFCSFSPLFSPFPFAARSPGEQEWLGKRCKISLSLLFLSFFKWTSVEVYFCLHFCLHCSSSAVLFLSNPGFSFDPIFFLIYQRAHLSFNVKGIVRHFGECALGLVAQSWMRRLARVMSGH